MRSPTQIALIAMLILIWGSTWVVIKIGLADLPPFSAAGLRFGLSAIVLFALGRVQRVPFPRARAEHLGLVGIGLSAFALSYGALYWAQQFIPSGLAAVLFATFPLFVLVIAHLALAAEPLSARKVAGAVVGLIGVVLIFQADLSVSHPRALTGASVALLSPFAAACSSVGIKRWGQAMHPYNLTTLPMAYGAAVLLVIGFATEDWSAMRFSPVAIGSIVYLALFGSVIGFVTYYSLLKQVDVSRMAFITYTFPIVALALGALVLDESLGTSVIVGSAVVVLGVVMATAGRPRTAIRGQTGSAPDPKADPTST